MLQSGGGLSLYSSGMIVVAAVCVAAGLQHLLIASRVERWQVRLLFALTALAVAADALVHRRTVSSLIGPPSDVATFRCAAAFGGLPGR